MKPPGRPYADAGGSLYIGPIKKEDLFYYAHMHKDAHINNESALKVGTKVGGGQQRGLVRDTGEGMEGTWGRFSPHLRFGYWYDTGSDSSRTHLEFATMNSHPLVLWLEQNGGAISGGIDTA